MTKSPIFLASALIFLTGGVALAQQQYDSLGSPTPAPNQNASPSVTGPNVPVPVNKGDATPATDGSVSAVTKSPSAAVNTPGKSEPTTATDSSGAKIPGAITDD